MLLVQKFHSLQEIDPEFIGAIEILMQEHWANFAAWREAESKCPPDETFIYWLFFGPTQNSPIGIAQVSLKKIDAEQFIPWWKKVTGIFDKNLDHWKMARWQLARGIDGAAVFDSRFSRTGKEKLIEVIKEVATRKDVMAMTLLSANGPLAYKPEWPEVFHEAQHSWSVLKPWIRMHKAYQDYLAEMPEQDAKRIQQNWKKLHKEIQVELGDYPTIESREDMYAQFPSFDRTILHEYKGGILTFQKDEHVLGMVRYHEGQKGILFVEPVPLEPQGSEKVVDELYVQYALLKAHELPHIKKMIMVRQGGLFKLNNDAEADFFKSQGFQTNQISEQDWSRSAYLK
ncbi:MAG: hypothetical protein K2P81_14910 [Bacteriovoracaceae bacterium]|nr:hypothetical protein [Bacteriovoracaceae bacterium]